MNRGIVANESNGGTVNDIDSLGSCFAAIGVQIILHTINCFVAIVMIHVKTASTVHVVSQWRISGLKLRSIKDFKACSCVVCETLDQFVGLFSK